MLNVTMYCVLRCIKRTFHPPNLLTFVGPYGIHVVGVVYFEGGRDRATLLEFKFFLLNLVTAAILIGAETCLNNPSG